MTEGFVDEEQPIRIWSPRAVALYGLLLAFPCALMVAIRDWQALRMNERIRPHLIAAIAFSVLLFTFVVLHPAVGRPVGFVTNIAAFSYFRERLRSDIAEFQKKNPSTPIVMRSWASASGWAVLPLLIIVGWVMVIGVAVEALHPE